MLAVLSVGCRAGADAKSILTSVHQGTTRRGAVGIAGALAPDELLALAVSNIVCTRWVGLEGARLNGVAALAVVLVASLVPSLIAASAALAVALINRIVILVPDLAVTALGLIASIASALKPAALFARLVLSADTRADADGLTALWKSSTASRGAISSPETLTANELQAIPIAHILFPGRVGDILAGGQVRRTLNS